MMTDSSGRQDPVAIVKSWDYDVSLSARRRLRINVAAIRRACHLPQEAVLRAGVVWHSPGSSLRGSGTPVDLAPGADVQEVEVECRVDARDVTQRLRLRTVLVLGSGIANPLPLGARIPGCILWDDQKILQVEGLAGRFPVEVLDFSNAGWLPAESAGWFLDWSSESLDAPVLGGLRLLINSTHAKVMKAVQAVEPDPEDCAIRSAMRYDVGRAIVVGALENPDFVDAEERYEDESVGLAAWRLVKVCFPDTDFEFLRNLCLHRTFRLECMLQEKFGLFDEH